jgi:hypothetical protein
MQPSPAQAPLQPPAFAQVDHVPQDMPESEDKECKNVRAKLDLNYVLIQRAERCLEKNLIGYVWPSL